MSTLRTAFLPNLQNRIRSACLAGNIVRLDKLNEDARTMREAGKLQDLSAQAIFDSIKTWDDVCALVERGEPETEHLELKLRFPTGEDIGS